MELTNHETSVDEWEAVPGYGRTGGESWSEKNPGPHLAEKR